MKKNTAGQKWQVFAFNRTNSEPVLGDAANITANLRKDWGEVAAIADLNPVELEDGKYLFDMLQAESNADALALYPESSSSDVQVIAQPEVLYTTEPTAGVGTIEVDHDYGGTDNLQYVTNDGNGIGGATVRAYLASEYSQGNRSQSYIVAVVNTASDGRWVRSMMLEADVYTLVYYKSGAFGPDVKQVTISD